MILNGQPVLLTRQTTLMELLLESGFDPARVAVMRNGEIVPRADLDHCPVSDEDSLEVVSFVGGG